MRCRTCPSGLDRGARQHAAARTSRSATTGTRSSARRAVPGQCGGRPAARRSSHARGRAARRRAAARGRRCRECSRCSRAPWPSRWRPRTRPARSRSHARGWSPPARRSGAGFVATCTTGSARCSPESSSPPTRPPTPPRPSPESRRRCSPRCGPISALPCRRCAGSSTTSAPSRSTSSGWCAALEIRAAQTVRRADGAPLVVTVETDLDQPLPAALEVAAYRIATEALTNVVRHVGRVAGADPAERPRGRSRGRGPRRRPTEPWGTGVGTASMRERAEELGGTCERGPGSRRRPRARPHPDRAPHDPRPRRRRSPGDAQRPGGAARLPRRDRGGGPGGRWPRGAAGGGAPPPGRGAARPADAGHRRLRGPAPAVTVGAAPRLCAC